MARKHSDKLKQAMSMLTPAERANGTPVFKSAAWMDRKLSAQVRKYGMDATLKANGLKMRAPESVAEAERPKIQWYEQWIPFYMMHLRGIPIGYFPYLRMQVLRAIHYTFFHKVENKDVRIHTATNTSPQS